MIRQWLAGALACLLLIPAASGAPPEVVPAELLARNITRLALMDLRASQSPGPEDYRVAATMLTIAHELVPEDPDIVRHAIEAAYAAGDEPKVLELTRDLLRIPSEAGDDVAALRLITATIAKRQNAEDRLAEYEAYLSGPKKPFFSEAIRSRLALDAALLLRERGDMQGFVQKLTQATQLDPTHKEAAALGAAYYAERVPDDRRGALEWLVILLKADPVDPNIQMTIARELASAGAYEAARRFHTNALRISIATGNSGEDLFLQQRVLQWYVEGPKAVIATINHELMVQRDGAAREIRRRKEARLPTENAPKPEDIRLTFPVASIAALAAQAAGDEAAARAAVEDAAGTLRDAMPKIADAVRQGTLTPEQAQIRLNGLILQLESLRVWSGVQLEEARKELAAAQGAPAENVPPAMPVLNAWVQLRTGDPAGALAALEPLVGIHPLARLGACAAREQLGQKAEAIAEYRRILRDQPLELTGAWARARLQALGSGEDATLRAALERVAAGVPSYIDVMVSEPQRFLQLRAEALNLSPEAIERTPVRVSIENLAEIPLALGADRPISSRFLLSPKLDALLAGGPLDRAEVIDLNRRLRLMPHERLTVTLWPDPGQSGWMMEAMAHRSFRVRWRLIQGFRLDPGGGFYPGPLGLTADTDSVIKRPLPESTLTAAQMSAKVAGDPVEVVARVAEITRAFLLSPALRAVGAPRAAANAKPGEPAPAPEAAPPEPAPEELKPVVDALVARYQNLPAMQRGILAAILPHARLAPVMAPFDQIVRADEDPVVRAVALATRVIAPDDELVAKSAQSPDERTRLLAADIGRRAESKTRLYARLTPEDLNRPAPAVAGKGP